MKQNVARKLNEAPWWVQYLIFTASFGLALWFMNAVIFNNPVIFEAIVVQAVLYGILMTWFARRFQKQADDALGMRPSFDQRLELAKTLKTAKLPKDESLRAALPSYLDRIEKQNRRVRVYGPIEFALFAGLGLYLAISGNEPIWYAFTGFFIGFGVLCYFQPTSVLERIAKLRKKLHSTPAAKDKKTK